MFGLKPPLCHLPVSRSTATVSPQTSAPLARGSPASAQSSSSHSGFAAALRKLAKQAEEPRGSCISSESSPDSSPTTKHSSPVISPSQGTLGPIPIRCGGHSGPSNPPVVTIAPTKAVNGLRRNERRQADRSGQGPTTVPNVDALENGPSALPPHTVSTPYTLRLAPESLMPESCFQPLSLPSHMQQTLPQAFLHEVYPHSFRPYFNVDELRVPSLPLGVYPSGYLPHLPFSTYRKDISHCLSSLRSSFYPPNIHLHLPGVCYPEDLSECLAERLQMEKKEREAKLHKESNHENVSKCHQSQYLAGLKTLGGMAENTAKAEETDMPTWPDKGKDASLTRPGLTCLAQGGVEAVILQLSNEEHWLVQQKKLQQENRGPQLQAHEFNQEQGEAHRSIPQYQEPGSHDVPPPLRNPPSLITPKPPQRDHTPPTSLWNPASFIFSSSVSQHSMELLARNDTWTPQHGEKYPLSQRPIATMDMPTKSLFRACSSGSSSDHTLVYDEVLQPRCLLVSKLDLEEKQKTEAREKGYYYDLDDSYDESDEDEVRAHLRRVTEQPPLKLDKSSEKLDFLQLVGLTTHVCRAELLQRQKRKRRRMLRERSPSPPAVQNKRPTQPRSPLVTHFTADEMDSGTELEDKKRFLTVVSLAHVGVQQKRDREKVLELGQAMNGRSVTLDSVKHGMEPLCKSPSNTHPDPMTEPTLIESLGPHAMPPNSGSHTVVAHRPKGQPLLLPMGNTRPGEDRRNPKLNGIRRPCSVKEEPFVCNSRKKSLENITVEEFRQHFRKSVPQPTQKVLQKHKGCTPSDPDNLPSLVHTRLPILRGSPYKVSGQHSSATQADISPNADEEEEEVSPNRWQGIEALLEAYQEYVGEQNTEQQVLQSQCRRLEGQHYRLVKTAEQLSSSWGELLCQKQKLVMEREKLQTELDRFRKCLGLPAVHWSKSIFKGRATR